MHQASILRRSRPQPSSSVSQQDTGCVEHGIIEPMGLGRPAAPVAALERHPAASSCCPKPRASISTWPTACGRRVPSLANVWRRSGGQWALPLHSPALPRSRSGHLGIRGRLLAHLARSVEPRAVRPVARCTRCVQRPRCGSAHTHDLLRSDALADGRVSDMPKRAQSSFRNSA